MNRCFSNYCYFYIPDHIITSHDGAIRLHLVGTYLIGKYTSSKIFCAEQLQIYFGSFNLEHFIIMYYYLEINC